MISIKSVHDADVFGKRVLLRTSLNIPLTADGIVSDTFRLQRALPTISYLAEKGAKIIIVGYIGRKGESLKPVYEALQKLLPDLKITFAASQKILSEKSLDLEHSARQHLAFAQEVFSPSLSAKVDALKSGECLMLENIRREEGEEKNDPALAIALANLADIFVDDAFAEAHRPYASNVGVATLIPAYAGLLMQEEIEKLSEALTPPEHSLAIIGGAKFETKEPLLFKIAAVYEKVLIGGALANDFLKSRGAPVGASLVSYIAIHTTLANNEKLLIPTDVIVAEIGENTERKSSINDVRLNERIVDIGQKTSETWASEISRAPFILWNGPMGVYEDGFIFGTDALAEAIASSNCRAVIGGGDTAASLAKFSFDKSSVFISTGGGAMLQFLIDGTLPAIDVLRK